MGRKLRFGGDNLPAAAHTWYDTKGPDGQLRQIRAFPGDVVDADLVMKWALIEGSDPPRMGFVPNAEYYVGRNFASYVTSNKTEPKDD